MLTMTERREIGRCLRARYDSTNGRNVRFADDGALSSYGRDCQNNPISHDSAGIRQARKAAGLTQEKAAEIIGATRRAWQEWEAGRRNMPGAKLELFLIKTKGEKMSRKERFLSDLRTELTDSEIVAGLGNGDIALPEWLAMSEGVDHVRLADFEAGESFQMGFTTIWHDSEK